jgi:putative ABC transport system substrate-binding protein
MQRRTFVTLLGGAVCSPHGARAQPVGKVPRLGFLALGTPAAWVNRVEALRAGLRDLGYLEGRNLIIEFRWADSVEQLHRAAAELVRLDVDIIFASSSTETEPARRATSTIPIVFATHADPVGLGHAASLPRPGGNMTGLADIQPDTTGKRLELLIETAPAARTIGLLWSATAPSHGPVLEAAQVASTKLGIELAPVAAENSDDLDRAFRSMAEHHADAVLVAASTFARVQRTHLAELALKHRLPSVFGARENVEAGGLMSYAPDHADMSHRAATYIDKILRGAKPADLPVEQASKYKLIINLKTAKALDLPVPQTMLARADEVME